MRFLLFALVFLFSTFAAADPSSDQFLGPLARLGTTEGHGSGFFINPTHVVTARHVIESLNKHAVVIDSKGNTHQIIAKMLSSDSDVAMLTVDSPDKDLPVAQVSCRMPAALETLVSAGFPFDLPAVVSPLMVIAISIDGGLDHGADLIAVGTIGPGMSGGPAFDRSGQVVAIVSSETVTTGDVPTGFQNLVPLVTVKELCIKEPAA